VSEGDGVNPMVWMNEQNVETRLAVLVLDHKESFEEDDHDSDRNDFQSQEATKTRHFLEETRL
jgi:hypothetical protein